MDVMLGIVLLIIFVIFAALALRGYNITFLFFGVTILWSIVAAIGGQLDWLAFNKTVINDAATGYGSALVTVMFGSWLGRVMLDLDIVSTIIRKTAELGGDKAGVTMFLLCGVTALIFSGIYGPGIVISIGLIVLPILLSLGVPAKLAAAAFTLSVGAPMYININIGNALRAMIPNIQNQTLEYRTWGGISFGIHFAITMIMAISVLMLSRKRKTVAWPVETGAAAVQPKKVPGIALITPILPLVLVFFLGFQPISAMIATVFIALATTGILKDLAATKELILRAWKEAITDIALLLLFLLCSAMFNAISTVCGPLLKSVLMPVLPSSALVLTVVLIILTPLGLFRGPLCVWGSGIATVSILQSTGLYSMQFLCVAFVATSVTMNISSCVTQSWNQWTVNYTKIASKEYLLLAAPTAAVICAVVLIINYVMFSGGSPLPPVV